MTKTNDKHWADTVQRMSACREAVLWLRSYDTPNGAWRACERGDWMLWIVGKSVGSSRTKSRRALILVTCKCARLALKYVRKGETRPLTAIETAERWARGGATLQEVRSAADAAYDASKVDSPGAYDAYAYIITCAAWAAYADPAGVYACHAAAAPKTFEECAGIVRRHYPTVGSFRMKTRSE